MKAYLAFCRKELLEFARTFRAWIMLAVFLIIGIMNPLTAKLVPDLLSGIDVGGMVLELPEPTALDSWTQFFKNTSQLGLVALIILFIGITAHEFSKSTLTNLLTKGVPRHTIIEAKSTVALLAWTLAYLITLGVTWGYTVFYWGPQQLPHAVLAFTGPWVFGFFIISLLILGGVWFGNIYGPLLLSATAVIVLSAINIIPTVVPYNPITLTAGVLGLFTGEMSVSEITPALIITLGATLAAITGSILIFNKKQI